MKPSDAVLKAYEVARAARLRAHAPYSGFRVGAAAITESGLVFSGCNVENASYGGCICAERTAILKAVSEGHSSFSEIVVVSDGPTPAPPCGLCLQMMAEFFSSQAVVWLADLKSVRSGHAFSELLPIPFGPKQLASARASTKA